jgi:hypothetical protein
LEIYYPVGRLTIPPVLSGHSLFGKLQ